MADNSSSSVAPSWLSWLFMLALFIIFFVTKLFGYIDVPVITSLLIVILALRTIRTCNIDESVQFYFIALYLFSCYALLISVLNSAQEIIFALKFLRTLLLFTLLYFVWHVFSKYYSYESFLKSFAIMAFVHALIVISCILSIEFREAVYSVTGFSPRGPGWTRSPGLTISYNSPAILHILGLWVVLTRPSWSLITRAIMALILLVSLIFMGRTIAFLGLMLIATYLLFLSKAYLRSCTILVSFVLVVLLLQNDELVRSSISVELYSSVRRFLDPLTAFGSARGLDAFFAEFVASHVYVSDDIYTLLFGNGLSGHIGIIDPVGETQSDMGVINSINANGIFVTALVYLFYLLMLWQCRRGDWRTVSFVVFLSLALSFKETGLFVSHATPVLFFLFFYNRSTSRAIQVHPILDPKRAV